MKLFKWFRGMWERVAPTGDTKAEQVPPDANRQISESDTAGSIPSLMRLKPDAFTHQFLKWTSRHAEYGRTDVRRLEGLMAEFAEVYDLMPLERETLFCELDRLGIASDEPDVFDYAHGCSQKRVGGRRLTMRFYVLPQRYPIRPAPRMPLKPSPSAQYDLFKSGGRGSRHGR
jgi:hypothetical protein